MKVRDIMSKEVCTLSKEDTIEKAARLMKDNDVGSIPVCNQDIVVGIVTDRDITLRAVADGSDTHHLKVKDIMTSNPFVGNPEMEVHEVAKIMSDKQIRRLPIVENNNLVGIVALADISLESSIQDKAEDTLKCISEPKKHYT